MDVCTSGRLSSFSNASNFFCSAVAVFGFGIPSPAAKNKIVCEWSRVGQRRSEPCAAGESANAKLALNLGFCATMQMEK